eukprot:3604738-Ditylum_brightwellii.AAC.1
MFLRLQHPTTFWKVSDEYDTTFGQVELTNSEGVGGYCSRFSIMSYQNNGRRGWSMTLQF